MTPGLSDAAKTILAVKEIYADLTVVICGKSKTG
jgi:hypothetical protein